MPLKSTNDKDRRKIREAKSKVERYRNELNRLVCKRTDLLVHLSENTNYEFKLTEGINLNVKISTYDKVPPLKVFITY